jgi:CRISPR/Cas system CMR-associated protein Cmr3 (group 5 of RAMP superfamily)
MEKKKRFAAYVNKLVGMNDAEIIKEQAKVKARLDKHRINHLGQLLTQIEFWSQRYEFSFQFWGDINNVYINKDDVEIMSTGGHVSIMELLIEVIVWCEKANPRIKFPSDESKH